MAFLLKEHLTLLSWNPMLSYRAALEHRGCLFLGQHLHDGYGYMKPNSYQPQSWDQ